MIQRFVITGGPATGKSSIIECFQQLGYPCFEEISREIIQELNIQTSAKKFDFESVVFQERKIQYLAATKLHFYDRSMLDGLAYMKLQDIPIPKHMLTDLKIHRYESKVFIAPAWEEIYHQDSERLESFEEAIAIEKSLREIYQFFGYDLVEIPLITIEERVRFILSNI
tara:strand:- start:3764 stop:4270 length:507 start_codon:yes stop_codon:yes gene_type:complete